MKLHNISAKTLESQGFFRFRSFAKKKKIIFDFDSQFQVTRSIYGNNRNSKNVWQVYDEYECMAFLKKNNGTMYECQTHFTNILLKQLVSE